MNPCHKLLRAALLLAAACTLQSCIYGAIHRDRCAALLTDGTEVAGKLKLPREQSDRIRIRPDRGPRRTIAADSLGELRIWHRRTPERSYLLRRGRYLYYGLAQGGPTRSQPGWFVSRAVGPHLSIYARSDGFEFGKDGRIVFRGTVCYLAYKPGFEAGVLIGTSASSRSSLRQSLLRLCADDPELCALLESGRMDPSDFRQVVEAYDPTDRPRPVHDGPLRI